MADLGMAQLIHESSTHVASRDGVEYRVWVMGQQREDGSWHGWIEFHPDSSGPVLVTGRETTQVSRGALHYWAGGLEPIYFDGALARAQPITTPSRVRVL